MKKRNYVIISLSPWDFGFGSNIRDISIELSKSNNVLFVNIPLKRTEVWGNKVTWKNERIEVIKSKENKIDKINDGCFVLTTPVVFEPINKLKPAFLFDILNRVNCKRYAQAIKKAISSLGFEEYILINDNDFYSGYYLPDFLQSTLNVYYLRDYMRAMDYWKSHADRLEPLLIAKYDLTLSNSLFLANYAKKFNPKAHYVGQGCEVDHFLTPPVKRTIKDLENLNTIKIGYIGALNSERLDIDLIGYIAQSNPKASVVLIGPEDDAFKSSNLHQIPNIRFLGSKDFNEIKDYMYCFNVCINPQKINEITIGNYPRKIDEYLAAGRPVVATYTETMVPFEKVTYLAKNEVEFSKMIILAAEEDNEEKIKERKEFAMAHTWQNSVQEMLLNIG